MDNMGEIILLMKLYSSKTKKWLKTILRGQIKRTKIKYRKNR